MRLNVSPIGSCSVVFTADQGVRGGKVIPLKQTVDEALKGCDCVRRVFVARRTGAKVPFTEGRDVWLDEVRDNVFCISYSNLQ